MRTATFSTILVLCALALAAGLTISSPAGDAVDRTVPESSVGRAIDNFTLRDFRGKLHALDDYRDSPVVVLAFLGTECPLAKLYAPRLSELAATFESQGVKFLGINSNRQDTLTEVGAYARIYKIAFPILKDPDNAVADRLGAERTPEVFVLDSNRTVRYQGRIDDQYGVGYQRGEPQRRDLAVALEELLAGKPVSQPRTKAIGCFIGRVHSPDPVGNVTYTKDIAGVLNRRCVECHREGEIAPFPLTSYEDAASWADTIREVMTIGRMPPWFANPQYGHFANEVQIPADEKALVYQWIENGCPEGNPADLPPAPTFVSGWRIPKPDLVIPMRDKPYDVPAEGVVDYQYFKVDPGFTEDKYITAAEARPQNTAVVHHIAVTIAPPKGKQRGFDNLVAAYAPGMPPVHLPPGAAFYVPAGSKLVFQLHYTPNGTEQSDLSYVGFVLADKKDVKQIARCDSVGTQKFEIPPEADDYQVIAEDKFDRDVLLYSLTPHMHLRGKAFRYEAIYPDATREILLDVPKYDFNWQMRYFLAEPKPLPKGTRLVCTAHYDNSEHNLANPDPTATVLYGDQTWDEMMYGVYMTLSAE